jgi:hypothetical protein
MGTNQRTLAIIGASVLMLGLFLPAISFFGLLNWSYFDLLTKVSVRFITGLFIFGLGGLSLLLALKNRFKPLIGTGILTFIILVFDFVTYKRALAGLAPAGPFGGSTRSASSPELGEFTNELAGIIIQPGWGMYIIGAGAILLIVAGAMQDKTRTDPPDWNRNPPPPMNYS